MDATTNAQIPEVAMKEIFDQNTEIRKAKAAAETACLASIRSLFIGSENSDLVVHCGKDFAVHRIVLTSQSKFFANALKYGMKESESGVIELEEVEPRIVAAMMEFLYTQEYKTDDFPAGETAIEFELKVSAIADKLFIPPLKTLAEERFFIRSRTNDVAELLKLVERVNKGEFGPLAQYDHLLARVLIANFKRFQEDPNGNDERLAVVFGSAFEALKECKKQFHLPGKLAFCCVMEGCRKVWLENTFTDDGTGKFRVNCPHCQIYQLHTTLKDAWGVTI